MLAGPAAAACAHPASQDRLETLLVCPSCHTTLDQSNSPAAQQIKAEVASLVRRCRTERQILTAMQEEWGPTILSTPRTSGFDLLAWVLPLGGILLGAVGLAYGARVWSRSRGGAEPAPPALSPEDERRVDEALAGFE